MSSSTTHVHAKLPTMDIVLKDMSIHAAIGLDSWGRPSKTTQPVRCSIRVSAPPPREGTDDLVVDYSKLAALILSKAQTGYGSPVAWHMDVVEEVIKVWPLVTSVVMETTLPVRKDGADATATWKSTIPPRSRLHNAQTAPLPPGSRPGFDHALSLTLDSVRANPVIGLRKHEEEARQTVLTSFTIDIDPADTRDQTADRWSSLAHDIAEAIVAAVERTKSKTVERLAAELTNGTLGLGIGVGAKPRWLKVLKTDALQFVDGAGVEMEWE